MAENKKRLYDEILEALGPRAIEDFDPIFGQKGRAQKYVDHYERTQGSVVLNDMDFLIGQAIVESTYGADLDRESCISVCGMVKDKVREYNETSAFGRFFSYLNPFPNKYRDMRNEINEAKDFLTEKGVDRKSLDAYLDGKKMAHEVSFERVGNNEELIDLLKGMEGQARADVMCGINCDENLAKYVKTQEFRKFLSYEKVDLAKDREFLKKATEVLDDSNYDADYPEEDDRLRERHDRAEKELESLFDAQTHSGQEVNIEDDSSSLAGDLEDNFDSLDETLERESEINFEV